MNKLVFLSFLISFSNFNYSQIRDLSEAVKLSYSDFSSNEEISPIFNSQTQELYFVRLKTEEKYSGKWNQDIYVSKLNISEKKLNEIEYISELNTSKNNGICGINYTGSRVYLLDSYSRNNGLAYSDLINGEFKKPIQISIPNLKINTNSYGFYVHPDEKTIIISYQGQDSRGLEDLYIIEKLNNEWTEPKNLGETINSIGFEISPFLSNNKDTLYYSSNGQKNTYGGADIFYSVKDNLGNWTEPKNAGPVINSSYFDAYLIQAGNHFIWSSTRENKNANLFISSIKPNTPLKASFSKKDASFFNGSDGEIHLDSISGHPPYKYSWSNGMQTPDCYQLREGIYTVKITDQKGQEIQEVISVNQPKLKVDDLIRIPEIRYKTDSWEFVNNSEISSIDSLNYIAQLLTNYPTLIIRLISHTDSRGDARRNLILSENRSRACFKYLIEKKGIDPRRIIPMGMGEKEPTKIKSNDGQVILLTEEYINQFKGNQNVIEKYNQINRRTEGKVERLNFTKDDPAPPGIYFEYLDLK